MPEVSVTRRAHFNAAHRLHNPARSAEWNEATFGACNNPNYHGHNYELEVTVTGAVSADTGFVIDIATLSRVIDQYVVALLDHQNLNLDVSWFADRIPTAENIAIYCWERLVERMPAGRLANIRLWETPRNYVDYQGTA